MAHSRLTLASEMPADLRGFLERQAAEVAQLDDATLRLVDLLKFGERRVDGEHVHALVVEGVQRLDLIDLVGRPGVVQAHALRAIAAPLRAALPRVIHQHAPHDLRGQRQELLAPLPFEGAFAGEPDEGLVHQRRGLQRVTAAFARNLPARHAPDVVVDQRPERIECRGVAVGPALQETRDLAGRVVCRSCYSTRPLWRERQPRQ